MSLRRAKGRVNVIHPNELLCAFMDHFGEPRESRIPTSVAGVANGP
jgi:hypothetical protein